jgi:hypothetical protein
VYQMHDRKLDKEQWLSDQLTKSFNKAKNDWFSIYTRGYINNNFSLFKLPATINLSRDPMASRDAYQKLCGLIADPGSSW